MIAPENRFPLFRVAGEQNEGFEDARVDSGARTSACPIDHAPGIPMALAEELPRLSGARNHELHLVGANFRIPGMHFPDNESAFEYHALVLEPAYYYAVCKDCWPSGSPDAGAALPPVGRILRGDRVLVEPATACGARGARWGSVAPHRSCR